MTTLTPLQLDLCNTLAKAAFTHAKAGTPASADVRDVAATLLDECSTTPLYLEAFEYIQQRLPQGRAYASALDFVEDALCAAADLDMTSDGAVRGHLLAVPLLITGTDLLGTSALPKSALEAMAELFRQHQLVCDAEGLAVLPVLLGVQEAQAFTHAEVMRIRKLLAQARVEDAGQYVLELRASLFGEVHPAAPTHELTSAMCLLVAYARSGASDPFELARQLTHAAVSDDALAAESLAVPTCLTAFAAALAQACTSWSHVLVPEAADWWYTATASAHELDRLLAAQSSLEQLRAQAQLSVGEVLLGHEVVASGSASPPGFEITLSRSSDSAYVGRLWWPVGRAEWRDDALEAFYEFLADSDILPAEVLRQEYPEDGELKH